MNLANEPVRAVPKPRKRRSKPSAKQRGRITKSVYQKAVERAQGRCEACGWVEGSYSPDGRKWRLECAHLIRRWRIDTETTETEVAMLCGPSVNTGTCHNKVDYTRTGKEWAIQYREYLLGRRKDKPILESG